MTRRRWLIGFFVALSLAGASVTLSTRHPSADLPARLSDAEFWRLVSTFSEPDGYFDSDNLVSNEDTYQTVIPELERRIAPGGVYLGVGPDQNFSYIVAIRPTLAFITDVRRGNLHVHLMYKALMEISADRAEFLSRLFSRRRPRGVGAESSVSDLFRAYAGAAPDRALFEENLRTLVDRLTGGHGFALEPADAPAIAAVYGQFFAAGPSLRFVSSRSGNWYPTFADLQTSTDGRGVARSYLASEARFGVLRAMQQHNAIVPVVGNFGGPKALRSIGAYLRANGATVSVFYTSNVERYLFQSRLWTTFAGNVAALPLGGDSTFIRSCFDSCSSFGESRSVTLLDSMAGFVGDVEAGRVRGYGDVIARSRR